MENEELKYKENQSDEQYVYLNEQLATKDNEGEILKKSKASTNRRRNFAWNEFFFFPIAVFAKKNIIST